MRFRLTLALGLLLSPAPALACRCLVADTPAERIRYVDSIVASAPAVALGRFIGKPSNGARRFVVRERLMGSPLRRFWVWDDQLTAGPGEIVVSCGDVDTRHTGELVLVLERWREDRAGTPVYETDACATSFLTHDPEARALIRARRNR